MGDEASGGIWHSGLPLHDGEQVVYAKPANRTVGRRAVGGRLVLTDRRIAFVPNRVEQHAPVFGFSAGEIWATDLGSIEEVAVAPARIRPMTVFSGEWAKGLSLTLSTGPPQRFNIPKPARARDEIAAHLEELAGGVDAGASEPG
jgi:hypothetical protein